MNIQVNGNAIYNEQPINVGDIQMQQQAQQIAAPNVPESGTETSLCFKLLTKGIKSTTVAAQKELRNPQQAAAMHQVASENVRKLFIMLKDLANQQTWNVKEVSLLPSFLNGEGKVDINANDTFILRKDDSDHVVVRSGENGAEVNTGLTVRELREQLANEVFADPDLLEVNDYRELLQDVPPDENDDLETGDGFQRRCYEQALDRWGGISADRLVNLTLENLRNLADKLFDKVGKTAGGMKSGVLTGETIAEFNNKLAVEKRTNYEDGIAGDFEIVGHNADRLVEQIKIYEQQVNANRIESEDAETLIVALRKEKTDDKAAVEKKVDMNPVVTHTAKTRYEALQPIRDFMADLIQMQDPTVHDHDLKNGGATNGKRLAHAIDKHAETLAKLLIDEKAEMQGLDEKTKKFLTVVLNGVLNKTHGLRMILNLGNAPKEKPPVADLAQRIRDMVAEGALGTELEVGILRWKETKTCEQWLTGLGDYLNDCAAEALKEVQREISKQLDDVFKFQANPKAFEAMKIDEMFAEATKPKEGSYTHFVKEVLGHYFAALTDMIDEKVKDGKGAAKNVDFGKYREFSTQLEEDRRNVIASMLRYAPDGNASDDEQKAQMLGAILKGTGPLLQKMLQGLDAGMLGDNPLGNVLKDMKKNLAPLPDEYVEAQLLDIVNRSGGKITKIERGKTLGCASVAQAILCKIKGPGLPEEGKTVVVKLQRPNALMNLNREKALILKMAENTGMLTSYEGMIKTIEEEFDFLGEENNIREGEVYDTGFERVKAVKAEPLAPSTPTSLVMECAPGETVSDTIDAGWDNLKTVRQHQLDGITDQQRAEDLAKLQEQHARLTQYQKDLSDLSIKWVTEGVFGSGKFHGDLHGGNIMVSDTKGVTLIDFGNVTKLTEKEQRSVTKMAAAASIGNTKQKNVDICVNAFLDGLSELLDSDHRNSLETLRKPNRAGQKHPLMKDLDALFKAGSWQDAGKRIYVALGKIQEYGQLTNPKLEVPPQIFKFSQAQMRLQNAVEDVTKLVQQTSSSIYQLTADPGFGIEPKTNDKTGFRLQISDGKFSIVKALVKDGADLMDNMLNEYSYGMFKSLKDLKNGVFKAARKGFKASMLTKLPKVPAVNDDEFTVASIDVYSEVRNDYAIRFTAIDDGNPLNAATVADNDEVIRRFSDSKLQEMYEDLKHKSQTLGRQSDEVREAATKFVDAFINAQLAAIERQADELLKIKDPGDDKLKSFAQSMGTAIKQNLKAASKSVDLKLVNASA